MQLDSDCEFIVLCTDGVYEGLPSDERVVEPVRAGIADDESGQAAAAGARAVVDRPLCGAAVRRVWCCGACSPVCPVLVWCRLGLR